MITRARTSLAGRSILPLGTLLLCSLPSLHAVAQTEGAEQSSIHWAYAAYFGTGYYDIGDLEDVYVLRVGLRKELRAPALAESGRRIGITIRGPITVGVHDFGGDDPLQRIGLDSVGTVSAVPGVEIEIPIIERWSLKPLAYLGWGSDVDGDASAWIYWAGLKSRRRFGAEKLEWALVNALTYVGYTPRAGPSGHIVPLMTGLEFRWPLADKRLGDERVHLHWHVAYTRYLNELTFGSATPSAPELDIGSEWEAGVAFGKESSKLRLWKLSWDRVGLAYQFSSDGDFNGIKIVFRSLFHR